MKLRTASVPAALHHKRLLASLILASFGSAAGATDYSATFNMDAQASHNNNLRLVERDKTSVYHYAVNPIVKLDADTENTKLDLTSTFYFNRYDKSQFDSNDQNVQLNAEHDFENSSIALNAAFIRDSTITSELLTSGRISDQAERTEQHYISPSYTYAFSDLNMVQAQVSYVDQRYHTDAYSGYKNYAGNVNWIHVWNERTKVVLTGNYSKFEADDRAFTTYLISRVTGQPLGIFGNQSYAQDSKDRGVQLGIDYQWSEESLLQVRAGRSQNTQDTVISDKDSVCSNPYYLSYLSGINGLFYESNAICTNIPSEHSTLSTAEVDWTWKGELNEVRLNATKSTQPSSNGYVVDATRLASTWSIRLSELDQLITDLSLVRNRAIGQDTAVQQGSVADRDYGSATLTYRRQLNENWIASASAQYNRQKYAQIDYQASSQVFMLGIHYQPTAWHWSR